MPVTEAPEVVDESGAAFRPAAGQLCDALLALECADRGADLATTRETCVTDWSVETASWQKLGCGQKPLIGVLNCVRDSVKCPTDWSGDAISVEELADQPKQACGEAPEFTALCGENEMDCAPANQGSMTELDLNGDGTPETLPADIEDRRIICNYTDDDSNLVVELPPLVVPAGSETFRCMYGTWTGPDMGIVSSAYATDPVSDHHLLVFAIPDGTNTSKPDGVPFDCETMEHEQGSPLFHGLPGTAKPIGSLLRSGQRYYIERHNLNTATHPILVNATYILDLVTPDKLEGLASWFIMGPITVKVPPGDYAIRASCTWPADTGVLVVAGHMHERGVKYALDWTHENGTERIFEVDPWLPEYVSTQTVEQRWPIGEFKVKAGDVFTTYCYWHNPYDTVLEDPQEMCNTYGVAYPLADPVNCLAEFEVIEF